MLRIKLEMEDKNIGHSLTMEQTSETYDDMGENELTILSRFINDFLKVYGYPRYDKEYICLESVTGDEYDALMCYLDELRNPTEEIAK